MHVQFQLRTSDDLEIYELDNVSKERMEEICDLRQPVIFNMENDQLLKTTSKSYVSSNYGAFEVKVRNVVDVETDNMYLTFDIKICNKIIE